ncbi:hypothetical protein FO519_001384 [Halicephalobus sp. NKZ332]|nr:hypothetical protein FO519_001384 [Halicephalobus sp. NKZ332]
MFRRKTSGGGLLKNTNPGNTPGGQVDDAYRFENTVLFGRYRTEDDQVSIHEQDEIRTRRNRRYFRSLFGRARSNSRTNMLDHHDDEHLLGREKKLQFCPKRIRGVVLSVLEDWLYLALLGIIMAILSFIMDWAIDHLQELHHEFMDLVHGPVFVRYILWISYTIFLVMASAIWVHYIAPQAIGSGIAEMKTILRGCVLKEYLSFKTLISKIGGLPFALGSGIPIGKEGPFVHIASIVANLLSHAQSNHGAYANESRAVEMLAAGCAVGVACTFSAPAGGVLFAVEVTGVYFAVSNYWRVFFASTCAATVFRLLYASKFITVIAYYQTHFPREPFLPTELPLFAIVGLICGLLSAGFIYIHRNIVLFLRRNKFAKNLVQKYWFIYPIVVSMIIASVTFPDGFGKYIGGEVGFTNAAKEFFKNCTFTETNINSSVYCNEEVRLHWTAEGTTSPFITLFSFLVVYYMFVVIASTVPVPAGMFVPSFVLGGVIGRLFGELVAFWWDRSDIHIYPGVYAVVGAAAFCGGVSHTVSVAVIIFELTGQLVYIIPVMIAVLVANAVCSYLQPSLYDSIIKIKNLPYLPDIPHASSNFHGIRVEQFMVPNVRYLSRNSTYTELQNLLIKMPRLKAFPIVEDNNSKILIGSCSRSKLLNALDYQVGSEARQKEANRRIKKAIEETDRRFKMVNSQGLNGEEPIGDILDGPSVDVGVGDSVSRENTSDEVNITPESFQKRSQSTSNAERLDLPSTRESRTRTQSTNSRFTIVPVSSEPVLSTHFEEANVDQRGTHHIDSTIQKPSENVPDELNDSQPRRDRSKSLHGPASENITHTSSSPEIPHTLTGMFRTLTRMSFGRLRHRTVEGDYDLCGDEKHEWELSQLAKKINFDEIGLDTAPFQLVEHSSLFKVHSLFSLLGLNRAYVTKCGKLVGVVSLRDLRKAVEKVQAGLLFINSPPLYEVEPEINGTIEFCSEFEPQPGPSTSSAASTSLQTSSGPSREARDKDLEAGTTV